MREIPSSPDRIVVCGDFDAFSPEELFDHWVTPDLLVQWWPVEAEVQPREGGEYHFAWPEMDWHLRGKYTAFERGRHLGFTWAWDHGAKGYEPLQVDLWFQAVHEGGTSLAVYHATFESSEADQEARKGILEGWIHFGMKLAGLRSGAAT